MVVFGSDDGTDAPGFPADMPSFSTDSAGFSSDFSKGVSSNVDKDLQEFLLIEKQKAEFQGQIHQLNKVCWDICLPRTPGNKLGGKAEACFANCVDRFIDVSLFITNRFVTSLQKSARM